MLSKDMAEGRKKVHPDWMQGQGMLHKERDSHMGLEECVESAKWKSMKNIQDSRSRLFLESFKMVIKYIEH